MKTQHFVIILTGLLAGAALLTPKSLADEQPQDKIVDPMLARALEGEGPYMFAEHAISQTGSAGDLVITSTRNATGKPQKLRIRSGTTAIFRADTSRDEFTKSGGWYWRCGETEGKARFGDERPFSSSNPAGGTGPLIRVVYQNDGTVHWYRLTYDLRC